MASVARNFHMGIELHEFGLNAISTQLHKLKPELFETAEDIVIDEESGRVLSLYGFLPEPIEFNLHPVPGSDLEENQLFVKATIEFTLTDTLAGGEGLGLITRIRATIEASMLLELHSSVEKQALKLFLTDARFVDLTSDHPLEAQQPNGSTPVRIDISKAVDKLSTDPAFTAILNYLIEVFLRKSLERPLADFPFPALNLLADPTVAVHMRGLAIWNDTLGVYMHELKGGALPISGTPPSGTKHLSVGLVESTINKIIALSLPVRDQIDPTPSNRTISFRPGSWLEIRRRSGAIVTGVDLNAPDRVRGVLAFTAHLNLLINVKLGRYWVRAPFVLPVGEPSFIAGSFIPFTKEEAKDFSIKFRPGTDFFKDPGAIVIATDYRSYFRRVVKDWLRRNVSPILKKIPIIGWIIAKGVEEIVGELIAYFVGAVLDGVASLFLTLLLTALYNVARLLFSDDMSFDVYKLSKTLPNEDVPLTIGNVASPTIDDNQGGELVLNAWFDDQGGSAPEPPLPTPPDEPEPVPTPPGNTLPEYPPDDFIPALALATPYWSGTASLEYDITVTFQDIVAHSKQQVAFTDQSDSLVATITQTGAGDMSTEGQSTLTIETTTGTLQRETDTDLVVRQDESYTVSLDVKYDLDVGGAVVDAEIDKIFTDNLTVPIPEDVRVVGSSHWIFQLMCPLMPDMSGRLARLDITIGEEYSNWARMIPVAVDVGPQEDIEINGKSVRVWRVELSDEAIEAGIAYVETMPPYRILSYSQTTVDGIQFEMKLDL